MLIPRVGLTFLLTALSYGLNIDAFEKGRGLSWAQSMPSSMATARFSVDDPGFDKQGHLHRLNLQVGWQTFFPKRGAGVLIAIVSTGIDLQLGRELMFLEFPNTNIIEPDTTVNDEIGVGTEVAAIAAARANNGFHGTGVAFNSYILPIKVFSSTRRRTTEDILGNGMIEAFLRRADVIFIEGGCIRCSRVAEQRQRKFFGGILDRIEGAARQSGRKLPVWVAPSGSEDDVVEPLAADPRVIAVGSTVFVEDHWERSVFSNFGPELDFVAEGEGIWTSHLGGEFKDSSSGTSFAAAQMVGLAALILAEELTLTPQQVKEKITRCFTEDLGVPGWDKEFGNGRIRIPAPEEAAEGCLPGS